jgi:16S rRNA (guanine527-N7)-methyltransferase
MIERLKAVIGGDVSRETFDRLDRFARLVVAENERQNLVAVSSVPDLWQRHIFDGAQLVNLAGHTGNWCDIGSGPGLPGIVIAILGGQPMTLVEPRRLRADFLAEAVHDLGLTQVTVKQCKAEQVDGKFDFITARAVARLDKLFAITRHLAHDGTKWILPKGETVKSELDEARRTWQGDFALVPSRTHEKAAVVVAEHVRRRGK